MHLLYCVNTNQQKYRLKLIRGSVTIRRKKNEKINGNIFYNMKLIVKHIHKKNYLVV